MARTTAAPSHFHQLRVLLREASTLGSVASLVSWDQETYMPPRAAPARAEQSELLAKLTHERKTSKKLGDAISRCEQDTALSKDPAIAANLREIRRDYDLATKLPTDLVAALAKTGSEAQHVWKSAREKNDFALFRPALEKMIGLTRQKAECLGVPANPDGSTGELYDALLDEYEPGVSAAEVEAIFTPLRKELGALVASVAGASGARKGGKPAAKAFRTIDTTCITHKVDPAAQHAFGQAVLRAMGFDLEAGRLDITTHPFCSGLAPGDTRLTTRYRGEKFTDALYGTMHEGGHGLYEQGLPKAGEGDKSQFGLPSSEAISLGIHESQSRMWENFVGRSLPFWRWAQPQLVKHLGPQFKKHKPEELYRATNTVTPSLIRVEADEGTYNLHVMVRFELERALFTGSLKAKDVPGAWNAKYTEYLGVDVPDNKRGCLQDVHWSFGLYGYFPTYTLGNLYAAQFWEKIVADIPGLEKSIAKGEMFELRDWLRDKIHKHGKRYRAAELCKRVTGKNLSAEPLLRHLRSKAHAVYGV